MLFVEHGYNTLKQFYIFKMCNKVKQRDYRLNILNQFCHKDVTSLQTINI